MNDLPPDVIAFPDTTAYCNQLEAADNELLDCFIAVFGAEPDYAGPSGIRPLAIALLEECQEAQEDPWLLPYELLALAIRRLWTPDV